MAQAPFDITTTSPDAAVASGSTLTFQYPSGRAAGSYWGQWPARMNVRQLQADFVQDTDFSISYGSTTITVTYRGATTIPALARCSLQLPAYDATNMAENDRPLSPTDADSQYVPQPSAAPPLNTLNPELPAVNPGL